jgi:hypothetical protein
MIIHYGQSEEIENQILGIEDKEGIFLIEPKGKTNVLVSSFKTGKSETVSLTFLENHLEGQDGATHAFFIGVRPPRCLKEELRDRWQTKEVLELCEKIMNLCISSPTYDKTDWYLENIMAIVRDLEEESAQTLELLIASEDPQLDIDPSDLDLYDSSF